MCTIRRECLSFLKEWKCCDPANNLQKFISVKCCGNDELEADFIRHVINNNKWKQIINTTRNIESKLNLKQTMVQYIRSNGSLRTFCTNNAERNRILETHTTVSESVLRDAIQQEQLQSEKYDFMMLEVSNAESKYHDGCKQLQVRTFHCDPMEQISITLSKQMEVSGVMMQDMFGFKACTVLLYR